nr:hypothetical protein [Micromonospora sp. DSM 115978]
MVAQLLKAREQLAAAAVTANRAKADAEQAAALYRAAGRGSEHRLLKAAMADVGVAGDKSDKVARLINEIGEQIANYINHIAPGAAPATVDAMPSGERLVSEAEERARRRDAVLRKHVRKAGDLEDGLKQSDKILDGLRALQREWRAGSGPAEAVAGQPVPAEAQQGGDRLQIDNPITAGVMAVAAIAVGLAGLSETAKRRRRRRSDED